MVTLDCPACGAQKHIASEILLETGRYRTQNQPVTASAQSYCAPPLYHTAARTVLLQGIPFWKSTHSMLMLLFLLARFFDIAVAVVMDIKDIDDRYGSAPKLQTPNDSPQPDAILNVDAARDILLNV